jgi:hypothetical protein
MKKQKEEPLFRQVPQGLLAKWQLAKLKNTKFHTLGEFEAERIDAERELKKNNLIEEIIPWVAVAGLLFGMRVIFIMGRMYGPDIEIKQRINMIFISGMFMLMGWATIITLAFNRVQSRISLHHKRINECTLWLNMFNSDVDKIIDPEVGPKSLSATDRISYLESLVWYLVRNEQQTWEIRRSDEPHQKVVDAYKEECSTREVLNDYRGDLLKFGKYYGTLELRPLFDEACQKMKAGHKDGAERHQEMYLHGEAARTSNT